MSEPRVEIDYDFGPDFEPVIIATILAQPRFFDRFAPVLVPEAFQDRRWQQVIEIVRNHSHQHKEVPDVTILRDAIRRSGYRDPGSLIAAVDDLPDVRGGSSYVSDRLLQWCKWRAMETVLAEEELRTDPSEFAAEIAKASRLGDDLTLEYTRLDSEESKQDFLRNEIVPTPWAWLNNKLMGGPEKKDLAVVMTVINGGKTTVLTNIAREAAGYGFNVVFFTFEDGETKIKRRLTQSISGMTMEEMVADLDKAKRRKNLFLEKTGGNIHIKQLRSRRSTVNDAMSFVRSIADADERPVDIVITDYADRFGTTNKYSEPRHVLREVYEDCKFMASDLDVVHWTASQINTKQMQGKEVVGIEHGSESTGKFESCDIAIGFGQNTEDQRLGRITMYTSKMRDAQKCELHSLVADFERQRVYEPGDERFTAKRRK